MWVDYKKEIMIDHRSNEGIFDQIYAQLEDLLSSSKVLNGQSLIDAPKLSKILKVDEKLMDEVYHKLEANQYIYFDDHQRARVTKYNRILDFFNQYIAVDDGIRAVGKQASVEMLELNIIEFNESDLIDLSIYEDHRFCKQARLYKANKKPYVYLEEFFPVDRFPKLLGIDQIKPTNIYREIIHPKYDIRFIKNERIIKVQIINAKMAKILDVKEGLSHFIAEMVYFDQNNIPYGYAIAYALPYHYFDYDITIKSF